MAIRFRHDAAAVALPSNMASRKYGQSLVLQQQQQKYASQQAALDRELQAARLQPPVRNNWQWGGNQQGGLQRGFGLTPNPDAQKQLLADQQARAADFGAARDRIGMHAQEMLKNGEIPPELVPQVRNLLMDKAAVLTNKYNETQQQEFLSDYNAQLAAILSGVPPKAPEPTPQELYDKGVVTDPETGMRFRQNAKGDYDPLPQQEQQPQRPTSAAEAFQADPKVRDKYMADAIAIETKGGEVPLTRDSRKKAATLAMELYEEDNSLGTPTAAPAMPGAAPTAPRTEQSILEPTQAPAVPGVSAPAGTPTERSILESPVPSIAPTAEEVVQEMTRQGYEQRLDSEGEPFWYKDGRPAVPAAGASPPGSQRGQLPLTANSSSQNPPAAPTPAPRQVKVGGKPLTVTPGTLTPQETAARGQIMELPREERIKALMPYDPELKGKTLDQLLESPETKAQYEALPPELKTGNYREDMLAQLDDMLQHNVLNGAGQSPPDAYVGMRVDDITDPKAKAELAKLPRPKSEKDLQTSRGRYFIDPEGVIRARS